MSTSESSIQVRVEIGFGGEKIGDTIYGDTSKALDSVTNWSKPPVQYTLSNPTTFLDIQDVCQQEIQRQNLEDEYSLVGEMTNCSIYQLSSIREGVSIPGKKVQKQRNKGKRLINGIPSISLNSGITKLIVVENDTIDVAARSVAGSTHSKAKQYDHCVALRIKELQNNLKEGKAYGDWEALRKFYFTCENGTRVTTPDKYRLQVTRLLNHFKNEFLLDKDIGDPVALVSVDKW